ncbi:MAG: hypothetical protein GY851_28825 [bacterium]|nr:hypothetical protein [bacterium]
MNDYHRNTTTYAYNAVGALTSMTASGVECGITMPL